MGYTGVNAFISVTPLIIWVLCVIGTAVIMFAGAKQGSMLLVSIALVPLAIPIMVFPVITDSVDVVLAGNNYARPISFGIVTDVHIGKVPYLTQDTRLGTTITEYNTKDLAFVTTLGDNIHDATDNATFTDNFTVFRTHSNTYNKTFYFTKGNHDIIVGASNAISLAAYTTATGYPRYYYRDINDYRFVWLGITDNETYIADADVTQVAWLDTVLDTTRQSIIFSHGPLLTAPNALATAKKHRNFIAAFNGHLHWPLETVVTDGVAYTTIRALYNWPDRSIVTISYNKLTVNDGTSSNTYTIR